MFLDPGDEGDPGDPFRVGAIYNGDGMRTARIMWPPSWPEARVQDLPAGLAQRGVQAVAMVNRLYVPSSSPVSTPLVLTGEIHNFSAESRWLIPPLAHVRASIRLYDRAGVLLLDKPLSVRGGSRAGSRSLRAAPAPR